MLNVSEAGKIFEGIVSDLRTFTVFEDSGFNLNIATTLDNPLELLDLSYYESSDEPTLKYLRSHSFAEILRGKNAEVKPMAIYLFEGGTMAIEFDVARRLQIDSLFALSKIGECALGAMSSDPEKKGEIVAFGYNEDGDAVVSYFKDGIKHCASVTFSFKSDY